MMARPGARRLCAQLRGLGALPGRMGCWWRWSSSSASSRRHMQRHVKDGFVKRSVQEGMRSRAAYKLLEMQEKHQVLGRRRPRAVVDLGAAPGGFSVAILRTLREEEERRQRRWKRSERGGTGPPVVVVACDLLEMEPIAGVECIRGDFMNPAVQGSIRTLLPEGGADVVVSDMAPNVTGIRHADHGASVELCEAAFHFCVDAGGTGGILARGGNFLCKAFDGPDLPDLLAEMRASFGKVRRLKPKASRAESREVFLFAQGLL